MFRGRGGGLHRFQLPLPPAFAAQETAGLLVRVDEQPPVPVPAVPAPVVEQPAVPADAVDGDIPERPARSDSKDAWVAWAHHVSKRPVAELDAMTKATLVAEYGG